LRLERLQQLLFFRVQVTHIDNIFQKGGAGKYSERAAGEFHLKDLAATKKEGFSILQNPREGAIFATSHSLPHYNSIPVQFRFSREQRGILQGFIHEAVNSPSCEQHLHKTAEKDPRFSLLLNTW
jgi:hypothetical protein